MMEPAPHSDPLHTPVPDRRLSVAAWGLVLLVSDLPDIIVHILGGRVPAWLFWAKVAVLAAALAATWAVRALRRLRPLALVMTVFFMSFGLTSLVRGTPWFQDRYNQSGVSFFKGFAALYVLDIFVAGAVIAALFFLKRDRHAFFLTKGRLDAPVEPVRWLGIKSGGSWRTFGWIFGGVAAAAVFVPTMIGLAPPAGAWAKVLPLVPAALLFAAVNAFTEEVYHRAGLLATLLDVVGRRQTLLLVAVFFGLAHWLYGSPPGLPGALMTGFLGWVLGKSMLETRGFLWPWVIHFLPDAVIFFSYALARVKG